MRIISNVELNLVAGGLGGIVTANLADAGDVDGGSWFDGFSNWFATFFGGGGGGSGGGQIQTVVISAPRMSDAEKIAYDIQRDRAAAPGCEYTYVINPSSNTIGVSGTIGGTVSVTPSATGSGTANGAHTWTEPTRSWKCPSLR